MSRSQTPSPEGSGEAVDLAHLHAQTMGDEALAREVLGLFRSQSRSCLGRLADRRQRGADLAHLMVGSARGIGAHQVAAAAFALETKLRAGEDGEAEFAALDAAVAAADAFIANYLDTA